MSPFINEQGLCPAHRPGGNEEMKRRSKAGAEATNLRFKNAFDVDKLPTLDSIEAAWVWLDGIARAGARRQIPAGLVAALTRCVETWIKSRGQLDSEKAVELNRLLKEIKKRRAVS